MTAGAGSALVTAIYRYPVKGLGPEALQRVELEAGATLPFDRAYAIENGAGRFNPANPQHLPKINFVMLMRDERLATLTSRFDAESHVLTLAPRAGGPGAKGSLKTAEGRAQIEAFLATYLQGSLRGAPHIVDAPGHSFSDVKAKCLHIVNLASVREVERVTGRAIDPIRFRPNVVLDGWEPWRECELVGRRVRLGAARLEVFAETDRCAAVNVDPSSGARDIDLPAVLERAWDRDSFGVYARVDTGGELALGARLTIED